MKQLFAILMSLQMILVPVAFGQTSSDAGSGVSNSSSSSTQSTGDEFRENPEAKGKESSKKQLMAMAIGIFGASTLVGCGNAAIFPSNGAFAAGAIIYIMSEMFGGKAHADYLRKKTDDLKMVEEKLKTAGGGGEVQKEALESALANEKEVLSFINKRKKWINIVSLVFMVATAAAAIEFVIPTPLTPLAVVPMVCPGSPVAAMAYAAGISAAFSYFAGGGMGGAFKTALLALVSMMIPLHVSSNILTVGRIAFYAASAMIMKSVAKDMSKKAEVAQQNIDKLEAALAEFDKNTTPTNGLANTPVDDSNGENASTGGSSGQVANTSASSRASAINTLAKTQSSTKVCAAQSGQGLEISDKACGTPLKLPAPTFKGNVQIPDLIKASQTVTDLGNALTSGDLAGADIQAASLEAQAGRISELRDTLVAQADRTLKSQGKKTLSIDADAKTQLNQMADALKNTDPDASRMLASISAGNAELGTDLKGVGDLKENIQNISSTEDASKNNAPAAAAVIDSSGIDTGLSNNAPAIDNQTANKEKSLEEGLSEFEDSQSDISNRKDVTLFQQISNRYILNYPTLVRRKSLDPEDSKTK